MLDPNGPLPPAVYWRRRVVAIAAVLLAVALVAWGAVVLASGSTPQPQAAPPAPPVAIAADEPPPQCPDEAVRVVAEVARPEFRAGDKVPMSIVITNAGDRPCVRDTNRMLRELTVTSQAGKHVWSSNDCYAESTNERPLLQPGQSVRNDVEWSGLTSTPDCGPEQTKATEGLYRLVARLASLNSAPVEFRLTP
ncbi:hypothetical protein [Saccharopolyspora antimicrobica]|uniref:hypothetical protein n=1 Tax=Saccharopolyspora antimicrobica TaxID=455193 RepID=UPI000B87C2BC|nr:hypothetical protein [Saccharopolyspora antimicrobica]